MKKIYLIMCVLGIAFPYYHLINFLYENQWSMNGFWTEIFSSHPISMISLDLTIAATSFLLYILHQYKTKKINPTKYLISLFLVGFSLALPLYLYDRHNCK